MPSLIRLRPLAFTLAIGSCATVPETGRKQLNFISDAQMNQLGDEAFAEIKTKEKIDKEPSINERVTAVAKRIAAASGADFKWEFVVIDDPKTVNAFCLPGGKIAVYTGILPIAKNDAGLAAILGHEVAHAVLHHGAERLSQGLVSQFGLDALTVAFGANEHRGLIAAGLGIGLQYGVLLPYSRKHESEADTVGLKYMAEAGYNPHEAVALWERMAASERSGVPEFLSTHPNPKSRIIALEKELPEVMPLYAKSDKQPATSLLAH